MSFTNRRGLLLMLPLLLEIRSAVPPLSAASRGRCLGEYAWCNATGSCTLSDCSSCAGADEAKGADAPADESKDGAEEAEAPDGPKPPTLPRVELDVPPGALVVVCGVTGAGKSSLLAALLGEITMLEEDDARGEGEGPPLLRPPRVAVGGRVAYTAQKPWLMNATIKENILFGLPLDEPWYEAVVDACALRADLPQLPAGDATEVGEKGITLSGGQQQRIAHTPPCPGCQRRTARFILRHGGLRRVQHLQQRCRLQRLELDRTRTPPLGTIALYRRRSAALVRPRKRS